MADREPDKVFRSLRRGWLLLAAFLVALPVVAAWLRYQAQQAGLISLEQGLAFTVSLTLLLSLGVAALGFHELRRAYADLAASQAALRERTAELERQRAELELVGAQRKAFFDNNLAMMAIVGFDGKFREMNPAWQATLGHPLEAMLGHAFTEFVHPDDLERTQAEARRLSATGQPLPFENRYRRADGSYAWLRWTSTTAPDLQVFLATAQDVTAAREAAEAEALVRRAQERFQRIFQSSPVPIALTKADGAVVDANEAFVRLAGRPREELTAPGFSVASLYEDPQDRQALLVALRQHGLVRESQATLRRPDGEPRHVLVSMEFLDLGGTTTILSVMQDVTERLRLQREREQRIASEAELERLRRTDQFKTEFINSTAHELSTPLTPMTLALATLRSAVGLNPEAARQISLLDRAAARLNRLVSDMVAAADLQARTIALDKQRLNLTRQLKAAVAGHAESAHRANLALGEPEESPLSVLADEARLQLVLGHLLGNAIKFTPAGGRVEVSARREGEHARVEVRDTGIGLTTRQMEQLWRPYAQAHDKAQRTDSGAGLGLYVTKGIVELHGGNVGVSSPGPGKGATFWFTLPLAPGNVDPLSPGAKAARESAATAHREPRRNLNPGVGDDEPVVPGDSG